MFKFYTESLVLLNIIVALTEVSAWIDAEGRSCDTYVELGLCLDGSYGPNWRQDKDGLFKNYVNNEGFDATDKCCECIPSTSHTFTHLGCPPRIIETDVVVAPEWYDALGHTCLFYRDKNWCSSFGYGKSSVNLVCSSMQYGFNISLEKRKFVRSNPPPFFNAIFQYSSIYFLKSQAAISL